MEDGSDVPLNVVIEKICQSQPVALGYTDRKGHFSVTLAADSAAAFSDAGYDPTPINSGANSVLSPLSGSAGAQFRQTLVGCEIRASYGGLHSNTIHLTNPRSLDTPDIGTLTLPHRSSTQGGTTVSATTLNAPKSALKAYEHGMADLRKSNAGSAEQNFRKAVDLHPTFANAWYELGRLEGMNDAKAGRADFERAIQSDPKYILPYVELSRMAATAKEWANTVEITNRALRLDGESFPVLYFYNAVAQFNLKNFEQAEKKLRDTIRLDADHQVPRAMRLLGYVLANRGEYREAAEQMRNYLETKLSAAEAQAVKGELTQIEARLTASTRLSPTP